MRHDIGLAGFRGTPRVLRHAIGYHPSWSMLLVCRNRGWFYLLAPILLGISRSKLPGLAHLGVAVSMSVISDCGLCGFVSTNSFVPLASGDFGANICFLVSRISDHPPQAPALCIFSSISRPGEFGAIFRRGRIDVTQCFSSWRLSRCICAVMWGSLGIADISVCCGSRSGIILV